jgi:threonylcarbamoyladenosine tRNA methylthiotransferase MtaB
MSRRYNTADFANLVHKLQDRVPDIAITADMIAGFPGESENDHEESLRFALSMEFADIHVFRYSPRRGTAASRMAGHVPPEVKKRRSEELRMAATAMGAAYRARFLGERRGVLWEEEVVRDEADTSYRWTGLTDNYLRVEVASDRHLLGETSNVILDHLNGGVFEARVEERATSRGDAS